jgi:hypothetical protein
MIACTECGHGSKVTRAMNCLWQGESCPYRGFARWGGVTHPHAQPAALADRHEYLVCELEHAHVRGHACYRRRCLFGFDWIFRTGHVELC